VERLDRRGGTHGSADVVRCDLLRAATGRGGNAGAFAAVQLAGASGTDRAVPTFHLLDALGSALLLTAVVLLMIALIAAFPPGGLALAGAGGGIVGGAIAVSIADVLAAAGITAVAGILLMPAGRGLRRRWHTRQQPKQNREARDARREGERSIGRRLTDDEWRRVHDEISGQNYGYHDIVELIVDMFR
jgi:membrane protein implicated in regulation of membrane protease activity